MWYVIVDSWGRRWWIEEVDMDVEPGSPSRLVKILQWGRMRGRLTLNARQQNAEMLIVSRRVDQCQSTERPAE